MSDPSPSQSDHDLIQHLPLTAIRPAPENDRLYKPVDRTEPEFLALVESIRAHGILEPLMISRDGVIGSGHRRHAAAEVAGLDTVRCIVSNISYADDPDAFLQLLREFNRQRCKTFEEKLREELVSASPEQAYRALEEHREERAKIKTSVKTMELGIGHARSEISSAKKMFLNAVLAVIEDRRKFWPLSTRQIHYALLNNPPLINSRRPGSSYRNNLRSYKALVDLTTRARLTDKITSDAINDETRPVCLCEVNSDPQDYISAQLRDMFLTYRRDLLVSQPNHIELLVEKNTVLPIIEPVARKYCIPLTSGRGYCSLPPRQSMDDRYWCSGKDRLILLILSDFDPDGETIATSFARSMRDDFLITEIDAIKVALTHQQVKKFKLPPGMQAKAGSATRAAFVKKYGPNVYELEALPPEELQRLTQEAIESVLDMAAFNRELAQEKQDAANLMAQRQIILKAMGK